MNCKAASVTPVVSRLTHHALMLKRLSVSGHATRAQRASRQTSERCRKLAPQITALLARLGMKGSDLTFRSMYDEASSSPFPPGANQPEWGYFPSKNSNKSDLLSVVSYDKPLPDKLRRFILQRNYGSWTVTPDAIERLDNFSSSPSAQACTKSFIILSVDNWEKLLRDYK